MKRCILALVMLAIFVPATYAQSIAQQQDQAARDLRAIIASDRQKACTPFATTHTTGKYLVCRRQYNEVMLLIDDIQYFAGKQLDALDEMATLDNTEAMVNDTNAIPVGMRTLTHEQFKARLKKLSDDVDELQAKIDTILVSLNTRRLGLNSLYNVH